MIDKVFAFSRQECKLSVVVKIKRRLQLAAQSEMTDLRNR